MVFVALVTVKGKKEVRKGLTKQNKTKYEDGGNGTSVKKSIK